MFAKVLRNATSASSKWCGVAASTSNTPHSRPSTRSGTLTTETMP